MIHATSAAKPAAIENLRQPSLLIRNGLNFIVSRSGVAPESDYRNRRGRVARDGTCRLDLYVSGLSLSEAQRSDLALALLLIDKLAPLVIQKLRNCSRDASRVLTACLRCQQFCA
jgi:hypothetical protein